MSARGKLARVIEPGVWAVWDRMGDVVKAYNKHIGNSEFRNINRTLIYADRILAAFPDIEKIVERE